MDRHCRIAAARTLLVAILVFIIVGVASGLGPVSDTYKRYREIDGFTGTQWLRQQDNEVWKRVARRLDEMHEFAKQPASGQNDGSVLVPVDKFGSSHRQHGETASKRYTQTMELRNYNVNYGFAVMTRPVGVSTESEEYEVDEKVMARVMQAPVQWYSDSYPARSAEGGLYAQDLAIAVGLGPHGLGVNSVYVASNGGMAAFYPANSELGPKAPESVLGDGSGPEAATKAETYTRYDPRVRPWYKAAIGETKRTEYVSESDRLKGLSYHYYDYSDKVNLVRTAWKRFVIGDRTYIVCIDLTLDGGNESGGIVGNVLKGLVEPIVDGLTESIRMGLFLASPLLVIALLLLLGIFPGPAQALSLGPCVQTAPTYRFIRTGEPLYWRPEGHGTVTVTDENRESYLSGESTELAAGLLPGLAGLPVSLVRRLWRSKESATVAKHTFVESITRGPKNITERCVEEWRLDEITTTERECRRCGSRVVVDSRENDVSGMCVLHRDHENVGIEYSTGTTVTRVG